MKLKIIFTAILATFFILSYSQKKVGIIGLDTSHAIAFTKELNGDNKKEQYKDFRIVAAYPYGSKTIESSYNRIPGYIEQVEALGVEGRATKAIVHNVSKVNPFNHLPLKGFIICVKTKSRIIHLLSPI
jgi:hypothetical protein